RFIVFSSLFWPALAACLAVGQCAAPHPAKAESQQEVLARILRIAVRPVPAGNPAAAANGLTDPLSVRNESELKSTIGGIMTRTLMAEEGNGRGARITQLLLELGNGREEAREELVPLVYRELHRVAAGYLRKEAPGHLLQPTALINKAYIRVMGVKT